MLHTYGFFSSVRCVARLATWSEETNDLL